MSIEIEKKYRLTAVERELVMQCLIEQNAIFVGEDFEENTLFNGGFLNLNNSALRLRTTAAKNVLTYKEQIPSENSLKHRIEIESEISEPESLRQILAKLGYKPTLIYEKRRKTYLIEEAEIVVDELPFGLFMEIEGSEAEILKIEKLLKIENLTAEMQTYPKMAFDAGKRCGDVVESRFK